MLFELLRNQGLLKFDLSPEPSHKDESSESQSSSKTVKDCSNSEKKIVKSIAKLSIEPFSKVKAEFKGSAFNKENSKKLKRRNPIEEANFSEEK